MRRAVRRGSGSSSQSSGAGPPPAGNLQAWAREVRYTAARGLARERDAVIAVGHTADDQVETILYRLISSPTRRAVLGMASDGGGIVRPLLGMTRAETDRATATATT